jgi:hypothetical protein
MRIGQMYLTAMLATVPVAVAAILAATPTASPANFQPSFNAALQNAPLDPPCDLDLDGKCKIPNINVNPPNVNVNPPNVNLNPDVNLPGPRR